VQQHIKRTVTILVGICFSFLFFIAGLLIIEYRYFRVQSAKMIELQDDYRNYVVAVKKILGEYNRVTDRLKILESIEAGEKKKFNPELMYFVAGPPLHKDARIFSSEDLDEDIPFSPVNREHDYLKESMFNYFKDQNLEQLIRQLNHEEWVGYTDLVLERQKAEARRRQKRTRTKSTPKIKRSPLYSRAKKPKVNDICMSLPLERSSFWLSSLFGPRKKSNGSWGFHYGIDMAAIKGTPVRAACAGVVVEARYSRGYGNTVVIAHNKKYRTRYAHLNKILVRVGQKVGKNNLIGKVGATGSVRKSGRDASHLHFEVYVYGKKVNPLYFLSTR